MVFFMNYQLSMLVDKKSQSWLHVVALTWLREDFQIHPETPTPSYSTVPRLVSDPAPQMTLPGQRKLTSLSKASDLLLAPAVTTRSVLTPMQRRKRRKQKFDHLRVVQRNQTASLKIRPVPPSIVESDEEPDICLRDWRQKINPRHPTYSSLCSMSRSSRGLLYDNGTYLNKTMPDCLAHAANLMLTYDVDIL
jgi:hypothetical protein